MENEKKSNGMGIAALVLSLVSILLFFIPIVGLICPILAIIFGIVARKNGMGKAGLIIGIVFLILSILIFVAYIKIIDTTIDFGLDMVEDAKDSLSSLGNEFSNVLSTNVEGRWLLASSSENLAEERFIVDFTLNPDKTFIWAKYNDSNKNYVKGTYTVKLLPKTNASASSIYYEISLVGNEYVADGIVQNEPYSNTYEMAIPTEDPNSGALASGISGSLYFMEKVY